MDLRRRPASQISTDRRERRWRATDRFDEQRRPSRSLLVALVLASATVMTLDHQTGSDSPLDPVRAGVGEVFGPLETGADSVVRPIAAVPRWFHTQKGLREDVAALQSQNSDLKRELATTGLDRNRLAEYDALTAAAGEAGRAMVPARVIAYGPAQSFSRTVTIDAGSSSGVHPDQTVVNADGLVGRVLRTTRSTATVLLILDADSTTGARVGESMEVGFLRGRGVLGNGARLDLELMDGTSTPAKGDNVVTWGSQDGAPYVGGIPVGTVQAVYSSVREQSRRAVIEPAVDFTSLDLVGVLVPTGTDSDRALIEADGSLR